MVPMNVFRKRFIAVSASAYASVGLVRFPGGAAEYTYKYANDNPLTHPVSRSALWWAQQVKQRTGGQMEIQVFPESVLGSDPAMLTQLRVGALQFLHFSGNILSEFVPVASIDNVGFAWSKFDQPWKALDGDLGAYVRGEVEKSGIHIFDLVL